MPKPHRRRRVDRWLPGIKPEGWLACEEVMKSYYTATIQEHDHGSMA
ncbi:hypothetical protein LEMLEM_LOCUS9417, partial [Lemmus lemmus]